MKFPRTLVQYIMEMDDSDPVSTIEYVKSLPSFIRLSANKKSKSAALDKLKRVLLDYGVDSMLSKDDMEDISKDFDELSDDFNLNKKKDDMHHDDGDD